MNKKSVALILGVCIIVVIATLASSLLVRSASEGGFSRRNLQSTQAFWLAEAGGQRALWELNYGAGSWTGWTDEGPDNKTITQTLSTGQYSVSVADASGNNPTIITTGHVPSAAASARIERSLNLTIDSSASSPFSYAGFGKSSVTLSGNGETDSYDSSAGAYGGANINTNGDIGTNSSDSGAISLSGNSTVNGDANTGPEGTIDISGGASISGDTDDTCSENYEPVSVPGTLTGLVSGGDYTLAGSTTATLSAGDYKFSSLTVSANATLNFSGDVNLYITGELLTSGNGKIVVDDSVTIYIDGKTTISGNGVANAAGIPENFILYSTYSGTGEGIKITGNGDTIGGIYAPNTEIKITGNGDIYGSLVSDNLVVTGNGDLHYDENMKNISGAGMRTYYIANWQDQQNPYVVAP